MNRIYKVIWSKAKHCYTVVSEIAKSQTKSPSAGRGLRSTAASLAAALAITGGLAFGMPAMASAADNPDAGTPEPQHYIAFVNYKGESGTNNNANDQKVGTTKTWDGVKYTVQKLTYTDSNGNKTEQNYWVRDGYIVKLEKNPRYDGVKKEYIVDAYKDPNYTGTDQDNILKNYQSTLTESNIKTLSGSKINDIHAGVYGGGVNGHTDTSSIADKSFVINTNGSYHQATESEFKALSKDYTTGLYTYNGEVVDNSYLYAVNTKNGNQIGVFLDNGEIYKGQVFGNNNEVLKTAYDKDTGKYYSYWAAEVKDPTATVGDMQMGEFNKILNDIGTNIKESQRNDVKSIQATEATDKNGGTIGLEINNKYDADGNALGGKMVPGTISFTSTGGTDGKDVSIKIGQVGDDGTTITDKFTLAAGSKVTATNGSDGKLSSISVNGTSYAVPQGKTYTAGPNVAISDDGVISATDTNTTLDEKASTKTGSKDSGYTYKVVDTAGKTVTIDDVASAVKLSEVNTQVNTNTNNISSLTTTVNGHTTSINTLNTTVEGHTTTISTLQGQVITGGTIGTDGTISLNQAKEGSQPITLGGKLHDYTAVQDGSSFANNKLTIATKDQYGNTAGSSVVLEGIASLADVQKAKVNVKAGTNITSVDESTDKTTGVTTYTVNAKDTTLIKGKAEKKTSADDITNTYTVKDTAGNTVTIDDVASAGKLSSVSGQVTTNTGDITTLKGKVITGGTASYGENGTGTAALTNDKNETVATVTGLKNTYVKSGALNTENKLTLTNNDGTKVENIDLSSLKDVYTGTGVVSVNNQNQISVATGNGIDTSNNQLAVKGGDGISVTADKGVSVNYGKGLKLDTEDSNKLSADLGTGLKFENNAIVADLANINLSYKANGGTAQNVSLATGLNFVNGKNTTASVGDNGTVKIDAVDSYVTDAKLNGNILTITQNRPDQDEDKTFTVDLSAITSGTSKTDHRLVKPANGKPYKVGTDGKIILQVKDANNPNAKAENIEIDGIAVVHDEKGSLYSTDAKVDHEMEIGGSNYGKPVSSGIALGKDAYVYNQGGSKADGILFGNKSYTSGIAIGENSYALTGAVNIGIRNYDGKMGDITLDKSSIDYGGHSYDAKKSTGVGSTTLGSNSYSGGTLSTLIGSNSIMTTKYMNASFLNSLYASQNFGAVSIGAMNSIESQSSSNWYSGVANSVVGLANKTNNSNGSLIFGAGNEITNSIAAFSTPSTTGSVADVANSFRESVKNSAGGAVLAVGGANKADWATKSQIIGVGNTLTGTQKEVSTLNMVNGYQNSLENAKNTTVIGVSNTLASSQNNVVIGDQHKLEGIKNAIVIGSADAKDTASAANGAVVLGHNAIASKAGGVALGEGSAASVDKGVVGYLGAEGTADSTWKSTAAAVSVGSNGVTRQITNVAAGSADTDAVNVAQLKKVHDAVNADIAGKTFGLAADSGDPVSKTLGSTIKVAGGKNITTTAGNGQITVALQDNVTLGEGEHQIQINGSPEGNAPAFSIGSKFKIDQDGSIASNYSGEDYIRANGDGVSVSKGKSQLSVSAKGISSKYETQSLTVGAAGAVFDNGTSKTVINGDVVQTGTVKGLSNKTLTVDGFAAMGRAATEEQLQAAMKNVSEGAKAAHTVVTAEGKSAEGEAYTDGNIQINKKTDAETGQATYDVKLNNHVLLQKDGNKVELNGNDGTISASAVAGPLETGLLTKNMDFNKDGLTVANKAAGLTTDSTNINGGTITAKGLEDKTLSIKNPITGKPLAEVGIKDRTEVNGGAITSTIDSYETHGPVISGFNGITKETHNFAVGKDGVTFTKEESRIGLDGLKPVNETTTSSTNIDGKKITAGDVKVNGESGSTITGLTNTTTGYAGFGGGRAATEAQLKEVSDVASAGWNLGFSKDSTKKVGPGKSVLLTSSDNNIVGTLGQDADGNVTLDAKLNDTIQLGGGKVVLDGKTGSAAFGDVVIAGDKITGLQDGRVTADSTDAVNGSQLYAVNEEAKKKTTVSEGKNITVTPTVAEDGHTDYEVSLKDTVTLGSGDNALVLDGANGMIQAGAVSISRNGIAAGGNKITGVAAGEDTYDAVNVGQLKDVEAIANKGWNLSVNDGESTQIKPGDEVNFSNTDGNVVLSQDGGKVTVNLNKDITLGENENQIKLEGSTGNAQIGGVQIIGKAGAASVEGLSNKTWKPDEIVSGRAATEDQLQQAAAASKTTLSDGTNTTVTSTTADDGHVDYQVNLNEDVKLGDTISLKGSDGTISASTAGYGAGVTNKLDFDGKGFTVSETTKGPMGETTKGTTISGSTITVDGGMGNQTVISGSTANIGAVTVNGTNGSSTITGLTNTTIDYAGFAENGRAATEEQLRAMGDTLIGKGLTFAGNTGSVTKKLGEVVTIKGEGTKDDSAYSGQNVKTVVDAEGNLVVKLDKDMVVDSITAGDNKFDTTGITLGNSGSKNQIIINQTTISMGGNQIHNVAAGTELTDAVNKGQLDQAITEAKDSDQHLADKDYTVDSNGKVNLEVVDNKGNVIGHPTISDVASKTQQDKNTSIIGDAGNNGLSDDYQDTNYIKDAGSLTEADKKLDAAIKNNSDRIDGLNNRVDDLDGRIDNVEKQHTTLTAGNGIAVTETTNANGGKNYEVGLKDDVTFGGKEGQGAVEIKGSTGDINASGTIKAGDVVINGMGEDGKPTGTISGLTNTTWDSKLIDKEAAEGGYKGSTNAATESQLQQAMAGAVQYDRKDDGTVDNTHITLNKGGDAVTITNVAAGTVSADSKDAVNGSQLYATNQAVENNSIAIGNVAGSVSRLSSRVNQVGAGAAALAALHPLDFDPDDKWDFAAGYGNYAGANAVALGMYYRPNEDTMFSVGGSMGGGENMVNAGVSFKLGQGNNVSTSRVAMAKEIKDLRKELEEMRSLLADTHARKPIDPSKLQLFPDVPANHWAYEYIAQMAGNGILEGYPDGNFRGDRPMTRYEFAAILYRAMENGARLSDRLLTEFAPELERFTVDTVAKDKDGNPTIQRVRVVKGK